MRAENVLTWIFNEQLAAEGAALLDLSSLGGQVACVVEGGPLYLHSPVEMHYWMPVLSHAMQEQG